MAKRVTTERKPWHYTDCGLDNVYLVGIEVDADPDTGEEEPIIPHLEDLHDYIFLAVVSKPGPLTGREARYLRRHLFWTQTEAAEKMGFNSAQYLCELECKRKRAFDIGTDFLFRFESLRAFITHARGSRKQEAVRILEVLEDIVDKIRKPEKPRPVTIRRVHKRAAETWKPFLAAA